ncbi:hypothetical protein [Actinomadura sp. NTSP31]|uniref:hypothetical protein n=1 Tax=Actinomadura sp. NTSP31 TaxID=1735447 RepID=UPI0035C023AD
MERHAELADTLLPLAGAMWLGLAVLAGVGWYARREHASAPRWAGVVTVAAAVLAVGGATASAVQVVRIGHSDADAVWHGVAAHRAAAEERTRAAAVRGDGRGSSGSGLSGSGPP